MSQHSAARRVDGEPDSDAAVRPPRRRPAGVRIEEMFERQRTPASALPDPGPLVLNLARCVVEIMAGARDPEQIARWLEPSVYSQLLARAVIAARARQAKGRRASMPTITMGSCRISYPAVDAVEAMAVVHTQAHVRAVAMRLIGVDGRWRASDLTML